MYFGSVKFFKNLLLLLIVLAIAISATFAIVYHHRYVQLRDGTGHSGTHGGNGSYPPVSTDAISYQTLYPDFYAPQPYDALDRQSGNIYLTFDGAVSSCTADLLALLDEKGVQATFFLSGTTDGTDAETIRAIAAAGHTIGMSSWSADYQTLYSSVESYLADVYQLFTYIQQTTGITPTVFRFPGGSINSYNAAFYQELIAEMIRRGFVPYDWNINVADINSSYSTQTVLDTVSERLRVMDRGIILLRPDEFDLRILPGLLDLLPDSGFTCVPLESTTKPVLFAYPES